MKYVFLIALGLSVVSCSDTETTEEPVVESKNNQEQEAPKSKYSYRVFHTPETGWGYQVFRGSKIIINQAHVPAVPGVKGFETRQQAEIAVKYIMEFVEAGNERPSVNPEDLDSIGAINLEDYDIPRPRLDVDDNIQQIQDQQDSKPQGHEASGS